MRLHDDPDILDRIDDTLEQWDEWDGSSDDAARWDGDDWVDERRPEGRYVGDLGTSDPPLCYGQEAAGHRDISFSGERRLWVVDWGDPETPTMAEMENATELNSFMRLEPTPDAELQPFLNSIAAFGEAVLQLHYGFEDLLLKFVTGKSAAYYAQRAERPMAAAERTRSPRWRAGSRRTKRHARRRQ